MISILTVMQFIVNIMIFIVILSIIGLVLVLLFKDKGQNQHSVLRNYPVLGRVRYFAEKIGPNYVNTYLLMIQRKPFSRNQYTNIVLVNTTLECLVLEHNEYKDGFYIRNTMFPLQRNELQIDNQTMISTFVYKVDNERLFQRDEHRDQTDIDPYYLTNDNAIILGNNLRHPYKIKRLVGQSGMSYGALGGRAITALSQGLARAGTWMNTGEGGLSEYHLKGGGDIIFQIGPGLFGVRDKDGNFSDEQFLKTANHKEVKAFEIKLAQGAKTRGGHMEGNKVTEEIAKIRNIEPYKTVNSPNRFDFIDSPEDLLQFVDKLRQLGQKPVGFKIVVSKVEEIEALVQSMVDMNIYPDFITIDGGEGGTGATFQELQDGVGLPLFTALPIVSGMLEQHQIRDKMKIFASGKLITPDKVAIALGLGADLVNIARGMMISVGCIMSQQCHLNTCPVGVATTDPKKEKALIVDEKQYRVTNYITSLHEGLFNIAAAVGVKSPNEITSDHIVIKRIDGSIENIIDYKLKLIR